MGSALVDSICFSKVHGLCVIGAAFIGQQLNQLPNNWLFGRHSSMQCSSDLATNAHRAEGGHARRRWCSVVKVGSSTLCKERLRFFTLGGWRSRLIQSTE